MVEHHGGSTAFQPVSPCVQFYEKEVPTQDLPGNKTPCWSCVGDAGELLKRPLIGLQIAPAFPKRKQSVSGFADLSDFSRSDSLDNMPDPKVNRGGEKRAG